VICSGDGFELYLTWCGPNQAKVDVVIVLLALLQHYTAADYAFTEKSARRALLVVCVEAAREH
jgi:hypothetical protein